MLAQQILEPAPSSPQFQINHIGATAAGAVSTLIALAVVVTTAASLTGTSKNRLSALSSSSRGVSDAVEVSDELLSDKLDTPGVGWMFMF